MKKKTTRPKRAIRRKKPYSVELIVVEPDPNDLDDTGLRFKNTLEFDSENDPELRAFCRRFERNIDARNRSLKREQAKRLSKKKGR